MSNPTELPDLDRIANDLESEAIPYEGDFADAVRAAIEDIREVASARRAQPEGDRDKLLRIIAYTYQIAGAHGCPAHILDVLSDPEAATDEQVESLLPYQPEGEAPQAEQVQWSNIRHVVQEVAKFCFGGHCETGSVSLGAAYTSVVNSLTAKDGISVKLQPLPAAQQAESGAQAKPMFDVETRDELTDEQNRVLDHRQTLQELLICFMSWEPQVCVLGNVRADKAAAAIRAAIAAQSQGAQAAASGLTRYSMWSNSTACGMDPSPSGDWVSFDEVRDLLAAQVQGVKADKLEFWQWLPNAYHNGDQGNEARFTKYNMEVAYEAGRSAAQQAAAPGALRTAKEALQFLAMNPELSNPHEIAKGMLKAVERAERGPRATPSTAVEVEFDHSEGGHHD